MFLAMLLVLCVGSGVGPVKGPAVKHHPAPPPGSAATKLMDGKNVGNATVPVQPIQPVTPDLEETNAENDAVETPAAQAETPPRPALPKSEAVFLDALGWQERVGAGRGVWVDIQRQMLFIVEGGAIVWQARVSTAEAGIGFVEGSMQTPLGWHRVNGKIGAEAPWGQVFRDRKATKQVWRRGGDLKEDLVLTRILWLDGMEEGRNKGKNAAGKLVDSKLRCIYIHGTNAENRIGIPASHGCVRLTNDEVIQAFTLIPDGAPVLITGPPDA